jgi:hypothetical protein
MKDLTDKTNEEDIAKGHASEQRKPKSEDYRRVPVSSWKKRTLDEIELDYDSWWLG